MSLPVIALASFAVLAAGYLLYGRWIAARLRLDDSAPTPAHRLADGVDYVPTRPVYLLPQHFAAIAAAGPIAGPILACQQFGWLPCLVWIALGVVFIGAVHDFTALFASVRHDARSVAEIARQHVGPGAAKALLVFIWLALVYVVMAFADVTAATFVGPTRAVEGEPFNAAGAVAAASTLYLGLALVLGLVQRVLSPPLWLSTLVFVPATLGAVVLGPELSTWLLHSRSTWIVAILAYCFIASLLPLWVLLQPRGYLGGFVLYLAIAVGAFGVLFGGFEVKQPAVAEAPLFGASGALFPFLFVTIACGACSGFHGLVCSGTTSKQVERESHCAPIGYGAMLLEGLVAVLALATVMILAPGEAKASPGAIYGDGLGAFLATIVGPEHYAVCATFGAMAFSTFVFDTLDVAVRLGRYIVSELLGWKGKAGAIGATLLTVGAPGALLFASEPGSYLSFWTLFGTSNQLLAALTLLAVSVWLKRTGRPWRFTLLPAAAILVITVVALVLQARTFLGAADLFNGAAGVAGVVALANGAAAVALLALAAYVGYAALRAMRR